MTLVIPKASVFKWSYQIPTLIFNFVLELSNGEFHPLFSQVNCSSFEINPANGQEY